MQFILFVFLFSLSFLESLPFLKKPPTCIPHKLPCCFSLLVIIGVFSSLFFSFLYFLWSFFVFLSFHSSFLLFVYVRILLLLLLFAALNIFIINIFCFRYMCCFDSPLWPTYIKKIKYYLLWTNLLFLLLFLRLFSSWIPLSLSANDIRINPLKSKCRCVELSQGTTVIACLAAGCYNRR